MGDRIVERCLRLDTENGAFTDSKRIDISV